MVNKVKFLTDLANFKLFFIIVLLIGIFFRFFNLEQKVYWNDEVYTSLQIAGYTNTELIQDIAQREIGIEDLQKYQRPNSEKDLTDTIQVLASTDVQLPPVYFVLTRLWVQWFGYSVAVVRSLTALFSLLAFPCIYWLCLELFESSLTGWVAIALFAVSPFQILYAQEARSYSLWALTTLLASAALLRAMRLKTRLNWGIYAATIVLNLYTYLLSVVVILGHGIYVGIREKFRWSQSVKAYLLAFLSGIVAFFPWLIFIAANDFDLGGNWARREIPFTLLIQRWILNLASVFFDPQIGYAEPLFDMQTAQDVQLDYNDPIIYIILPIVILVGYSIYFLCRQSPQKTWLFILTLIGVTGAVIVLPDLMSGGQRSTAGRYLIPCYLGIELAVAYLLATKISTPPIKKQQLWRLVTVALISLGVISCTISSQAETWWNKYSSYYNHQEARLINQATHPIVITSNSTQLLSLSYLLDSKVRLQLVPKDTVPAIPQGFSDVFLYRLSPDVRQTLEQTQRLKMNLLHKQGNLWKLET